MRGGSQVLQAASRERFRRRAGRKQRSATARRRIPRRLSARRPADRRVRSSGRRPVALFRKHDLHRTRVGGEGAVFGRVGREFVQQQSEAGDGGARNGAVNSGNRDARIFGFVERRDNGASKRMERRRWRRRPVEAIRESESMSARQRGEPRARGVRKLARRFRRARAQAHDAAGKGEKVVHPVAHFSQQQALPFSRFFQLGYVARDFRRADDLPA